MVIIPAMLAGLLTIADAPRLMEADVVLLREVDRIAALHQARLWPGLERTPMPILLVGDTVEFLLRHPAPPADFLPSADYEGLGAVLWRPRQVQRGLLATFPVNGVPTIVIGRPGATGLGAAQWVVTVLHEHFHQLQYGEAGYFEGVAALDLSGGDQTGMWMLNYPLPYDSAPVASRANALKQRLRAFVDQPGDRQRQQAACDALKELRASLAPADRRYLEFQLWQEGVARYIELRFAGAAARDQAPATFRDLAGAVGYVEVVALQQKQLRAELASDFGELKRVSFYSMGAALALLMDATAPGWKARYQGARFQLEACS